MTSDTIKFLGQVLPLINDQINREGLEITKFVQNGLPVNVIYFIPMVRSVSISSLEVLPQTQFGPSMLSFNHFFSVNVKACFK